MKYIYSIFLLFLYATPITAWAQYHQVTRLSGSQLVADKMVTVTSVGTVTGYYSMISPYACGVGPYRMGVFAQVFFITGTTPLSYTFTFSRPVQHIRIIVATLVEGRIVAFGLNGGAYPINLSHLSPADKLITCSASTDLATVLGGNLVAPPGYPYGGRRGTSAVVTIKEPAGINDATVAYTGAIYLNGGSGVIASFYIGQITVSNSGPACAGDSVQLWGDTTITEPGTFAWKGPNGFTSKEQNPVIYPFAGKDTGIYTLTYITGVDTFQDTTHVTLLPGPAIPVITADSPACAGSTLHLSAVATPGATYTWSGPNGFSGAGAAIQIPDLQLAHSGTYTVTANQYECSPSAQKAITVIEPVIHRFSEVACDNIGYDFNGRQLYEGGVYTDTFPGSNGCDSMNSLNLVIIPGAEAEVRIPEGKLCLGDSLWLRAEGNGIRYAWYDDRGILLGSEDRFFLNLDHINNHLQLVSTTANNCSDTATVDIVAEGCCTAWMPNAFSPNGDGNNDRFRVMTDGYYQTFQLSIFNRWGERVFHELNSLQGWDGTVNGQPAELGTYFYYATGQCLEGTEILKKGEFLLIR